MTRGEIQRSLGQLMGDELVSFRELAAELRLSLSAAYDRVRYASGDPAETRDAILRAGARKHRARAQAPPSRRTARGVSPARLEALRQHYLGKSA